MEINKQTIKALLVLLYNLGEFDACEEMLIVYKKHFVELTVDQYSASIKLLAAISKNE